MDWYDKSKKELSYLDLGHKKRSKAWCIVGDQYIEDNVDDLGNSDLHGDHQHEMWAYGRIDFMNGAITLVVVPDNAPDSYEKELVNKAKSVVKGRYPWLSVKFFGYRGKFE